MLSFIRVDLLGLSTSTFRTLLPSFWGFSYSLAWLFWPVTACNGLEHSRREGLINLTVPPLFKFPRGLAAKADSIVVPVSRWYLWSGLTNLWDSSAKRILSLRMIVGTGAFLLLIGLCVKSVPCVELTQSWAERLDLTESSSLNTVPFSHWKWSSSILSSSLITGAHIYFLRAACLDIFIHFFLLSYLCLMREFNEYSKWDVVVLFRFGECRGEKFLTFPVSPFTLPVVFLIWVRRRSRFFSWACYGFGLWLLFI